MLSQTGYGVDVAARRADELEKRLLAIVSAGDRVLDLGCGAGGAAARLVPAGAMAVGIDQHDFSIEWNSLGTSAEFVLGTIRSVDRLVGGTQFDYCLCNRTIHYLPYNEAAECLKALGGLIQEKLFISFSGLTSDLGQAGSYAARHEPISSRFGPLSLRAQETFGITEPLTLYTEVEAIDLLTDTGWHPTWSRTTDFGNILIEAVT